MTTDFDKDAFVRSIVQRDGILARGSETLLLEDFLESWDDDPSEENAKWWNSAYTIWEEVGGNNIKVYEKLVLGEIKFPD